MKSLRQNHIAKLYLIGLYVFIFIGCSNLVWLPDQPQVLLHQSEPQILIIKNTHGGPITLIPRNEGDAVVNIAADGEARLKLRVIVVADLKQPESLRPQWFEIASAFMIYTEPLDGPAYLKPGPDEVIMLDHQQPGAGKEIRINFQRCEPGKGWQNMVAPAAEHRVNSDEAEFAPKRLCPQITN